MKVLLQKFRDEPAVAIAVLVGLLAAAVAGVTAAASGGGALVVALAALSSLLLALSGGQAIRAQVTPVTAVKPEVVQVTQTFSQPPPDPGEWTRAQEAERAAAERRERGIPDPPPPPPPPDRL